MKKRLLFLVGTATLMLGACGGNQTEGNEEPVQTQTAESMEDDTVQPTATFKDGVWESDDYKLTIKKSQIIQSKMENSKGIYITYELENKSDQDVVPHDLLTNFTFTQENETSRIDLGDNYHFLDAFGDDADTYNKMIDVEAISTNALLPKKKVEFFEAYYIDNEKNPVIVTAYDDMMNEIGKYEIKLK